MPRIPNATLEGEILAAAARLLERGGEEAVTLRAVDKEARTSTPTIYERFPDRDRLMDRLTDHLTEDLLNVLHPCKSVRAMLLSYLRDSCAHPNRASFAVRTFGQRYVAGEETPAFDLLKSRLTEEVGIKGSVLENLALAVASLGFGTVQGMIAAGSNTRHAIQFQRSAVHALRRLLEAFGGEPTRPRKPNPRISK